MTSPHARPAAAPSGEVRSVRLRVWDLPTRCFHGLLGLAVLGLLLTGFTGQMAWHFRLGTAVLALLMFRLVWGFVGGRWSRFSTFVPRPRAVAAYLRGRAHPDHLIGHSPVGALSVFAMLMILVVQVATGLLSDDAISYAGPLAHTVPSLWSERATGWHADWGPWIVMALITLHLVAVLYFVFVRRRPLVGPMLHGDKNVPQAAGIMLPSRDGVLTRLAALLLFAGCVALALWIGSLRP